jgi:hypothetical protein
MIWIAQISKDLIYGFVCAAPFVWTTGYVARISLCMIAPVAVRLWLLWSIASWSAYQYFKIDSDLFIVILGSFGAAHLKLLWSRWNLHHERGGSLTGPSKGLSVMAAVILSLVSAIACTYLIMETTSGFWWDAYFPSVAIIIFATICTAWSYRLNTTAFVWACALGGYVGSLVASVHRDWDMLDATIRLNHYDYGLEMLMLPEYFLFAIAGALAALLMLGLSRVYIRCGNSAATRSSVSP